MWDSTKIQNSFSESEQQDPLLHFNIVTGTIVSGKLWPLIFDQSDDPLVEKRTIAFMKRVVREPQELKQLNEQQARHLFVGVRDLWLAESRGLLSADEKKTLSAMLELLDDEFVPHGEHQSMSFSFCPSKHRRVLKFIENINELGDFEEGLLECIATMALNSAQFYAVWVDGGDLSYNNFENILPLDRALHLGNQMGAELPLAEFTLDSIVRPHKDLEVVRCQLKGPGTKSLLELDTLGLYQVPANSSTRGGQRFIFSSAVLSRGLTKAIKESNLFKVLTRPQSIYHANTFQSVNYVFRCNKFAPGDNKFETHLDTPYYDSVKKHVSKYTMLIYLSNGTGNPALSIETGVSSKGPKVAFSSFSTFDCVIFSHRYPHEGQPFIDNNKIFLRTELIFTDRHMTYEPTISKLFSSAVYFTLQSAFQPDYSRHAHELYERVNKAHWRLNDDTQSQQFEPIVLHKRWNGLHFATNGNDYWFPHVGAENNSHQVTLEQRVQFLKLVAIIAVLDYFNCRYGEKVENNAVMKAFRKECSSEQISVPQDVESTSRWIMSYLWNQMSQETKHGDYFYLTDAEQKEEYLKNALPLDRYKLAEGETANQCCPQCDTDFMPWKCGNTMDAYEQDVERNLAYIKSAPVVFLNQRLQFDPESILIDEDKIHFHTFDGQIACNFAGMRAQSITSFGANFCVQDVGTVI